MTFLQFFPIRDQIWPCCKIGQGQPRVIIWINYDRPKSPMLHTKPHGHWPFGSGEEGFWRVFITYGRGGHLGHVTQTPQTNFCSPIPLRIHMKFGFDRPSGFGEEDLWKWWTTVDGRRLTDDGPWLYYKLTNEPKGSGELKIFSSEAIRGMKLKLCINVHDISLYINFIFYCRCPCAFVAMAT